MSRTWIAVLAIIVIGAAIYAAWTWSFAQSSGAPSSTATSTTVPQAPVIVPGVASEEYTNTQYAFSIWYPSTATTSTTSYQGYLPITMTPVVSFVLPSSMFAGTNLVEAAVAIGATTTPSIVDACDVAAQGETATGTEALGGAAFSVFTGTGVGAGQIYQTKSLRDEEGGTCYEITELLHSGNIGMYPDGSVVQFNQQEFQSILDAMAQSFSFTGTSGL